MRIGAFARRVLRRLAFELRRIASRMDYISAEVVHPAGSEWRPPALPDWVREEMVHAARIEPMLLLADGDMQKFAFYATPTVTGPGQCYARLNQALGSRTYTHFVVVPWLKRGGADLGALHHIRVLADYSGASVLVIATEAADSPWSDRLPQGVDFLELGRLMEGLDFGGQVTVMARLIVQKAPATVHIINSRVAWEAVARHGLALSNCTRLFASLYCDDFTEEGVPVGYARSYLRDCIPFLQAVLTDNARYPGIWAAEIGVPLDCFQVVYFPAEQPDAPAFTADPASMKVLWAGRMDRQKRPDLLAAIAARMPDLQFDVYGVKLLDATADGPAFPPNVRLMGAYDGFDSLPHHEYAAYLNTSQWDGLPNVLLEATAAGLPVVSTAVGGIEDFLDDDNAYLVRSPDDLDAFVQAIRGLLVDRPMNRKRWEKAFGLLRDRHTAAAMARRIGEIPGYLPSPASALGAACSSRTAAAGATGVGTSSHDIQMDIRR